MLEQYDYDKLLHKQKNLSKKAQRLKREILLDSYKTRYQAEKHLVELELREARRQSSYKENPERLQELRERMMELRRKEAEHIRERQKQKIAENKCQESFFIPKYKHVTIGAEPLSIDGFLKLHFVYDATYCLIESDKETLPKKYISSIFFKVDEKNYDNYTVTAKIIFKEKTIHVNFASVGTKKSAYFLMQKLIKFYLFQGFNVKNASGNTIIEEEH
jgi:hypothetical protein